MLLCGLSEVTLVTQEGVGLTASLSCSCCTAGPGCVPCSHRQTLHSACPCKHSFTARRICPETLVLVPKRDAGGAGTAEPAWEAGPLLRHGRKPGS